ncbi:hypothetical protein KKC00_03065 [Patescibacteria group bacterium]|nr:hypothetical protein [Patescibacteria group bacterium]
MPQFQGRVVLRNQVRPGTFTIEKSFEEIGRWGKDAILVYGNTNYSVYFEAWRPDPTTPGIFEYAFAGNNKTKWPFVCSIGRIERKGEQIIAFPETHRFLVILFSTIGAICLLGFGAWVMLELE